MCIYLTDELMPSWLVVACCINQMLYERTEIDELCNDKQKICMYICINPSGEISVKVDLGNYCRNRMADHKPSLWPKLTGSCFFGRGVPMRQRER